MEGIIYYTLLLCAVAFAVVVVYLCVLLKRVSDSIKTVGHTFDKLEKELEHITPQLKQALIETNKLAVDTEDKLRATDSMIDTVGNLGTSVQTVNKIYTDKKATVSGEAIFKQAKPFIEGIKWSEAIIQVFSKWKRNKPSKETGLVVQDEETNIIPLQQTGKEG